MRAIHRHRPGGHSHLRLLPASAAALLGTTALLAQPSSVPPPPPPEVLAARPTSPPPGMPAPAELREQLALLYEFLSAPPEKLEQMRKTIEMIERMSPEDREFLRLRLMKLQQDAPALQSEIAEYADALGDRQKTTASRYWLSLRKEERETEREKMEALDGEARTRYLRERLAAFEARQAEIRQRMQDPGSGPPNFIPPPPPFLRDSPDAP